MDFKFVTADERGKLYHEVLEEPVTVVAKKYNLSDNGLRKYCVRLGIPLSTRGYWEKIKAGQKIQCLMQRYLQIILLKQQVYRQKK